MKLKSQESPQWIFLSAGGVIVVVSILTSLISGDFWQIVSDISLNIGISVIAVSIVDWIWRRIGGDPLMNAIMELRSATTLLADLNETGIKRVFVKREEASERKRLLMEKMKMASEVDMMGISLRSGWSSSPDFQEILQKRACNGMTKFRIMVMDPDKPVTAQRALEEDGKKSNRIADNSIKTLSTLLTIKNSLPPSNQDSIKIKVIQETNIYCSVIRADNIILVTKYLFHLSGTSSETVEVVGKDTSFFKLYDEEFNAMWNQAADWPQ